MNSKQLLHPPLLALFLLLLALSACAPQPSASSATTASSVLERVALNAYHRMEIAYLETGAYTTNALVDLELPNGVKWTLQEFDEDYYRLLFTHDDRPQDAVTVSPEGVSRTPISAANN